jgi:hypothetical protein
MDVFDPTGIGLATPVRRTATNRVSKRGGIGRFDRDRLESRILRNVLRCAQRGKCERGGENSA